MNQTSVIANEVLQEDYLLTLMHSRICRVFMLALQDYQERVPATIHTACHRVQREIGDLERKILNATPKSASWLRREIQKDKLMDIASATELILRLGREESPENYEEFMSLLIDCLDTVLYTQKNRKNIHFPKYKALFKLITSELKLDVAGQQSQVIYKNGQIYLRTAPPDLQNQIL